MDESFLAALPPEIQAELRAQAAQEQRDADLARSLQQSPLLPPRPPAPVPSHPDSHFALDVAADSQHATAAPEPNEPAEGEAAPLKAGLSQEDRDAKYALWLSQNANSPLPASRNGDGQPDSKRRRMISAAADDDLSIPAFAESITLGTHGIIPRLSVVLDAHGAHSLLCGEAVHYQSTQDLDSGWGCGYRNIQIICSHLLRSSLCPPACSS